MSVEKIDELTPIVDGLADNKACVFAYTEQAYQDNDVTGVSQYDFSKEQNIPDKNSTDTNPQVLTKGFRSQGSSIPRNFINHFIGRFSYNLNKIIDVFQSFIKAYKTDYQKNGFMYNASLPYQVGDVCMDVWSDNTFAFFVRTGNGGSTGIRPMVASDTGWTVSEHWSCLGTPQGTSQSFVLRDSSGRAQVASPSASSDIANKSYVDTTATSKANDVQTNLAQEIEDRKEADSTITTNLTSHTNNQAAGVHGATSAATAGKIMIRDSAGRAQVASPSAANDIANKSYVDGKTWDAASDITGVLPISKGGTNATTAAQARTNLGVTLANLGVTATAAELNKLDGFTGSAAKLNFTNNVTSDIQAQLNNNKVPGGIGTQQEYLNNTTISLSKGWYLIRAVGGGGGGGAGDVGSGGGSGGGGGGGSGESSSILYYFNRTTSVTIIIGSGGRGGTDFNGGYGEAGFPTKVVVNNFIILAAQGGQGGQWGRVGSDAQGGAPNGSPGIIADGGNGGSADFIGSGGGAGGYGGQSGKNGVKGGGGGGGGRIVSGKILFGGAGGNGLVWINSINSY